MGKYALDTLEGRVEEALRFLGMSGPLSMTEDALEALDALASALGDAEAKRDVLAARVTELETALREIQHTRQSDNPTRLLWRECLSIADRALAGSSPNSTVGAA